MDIGTGKATKAEQKIVPHHLLDITSPMREYNVAHFKRDAKKIIKDIHSRNKIPYLAGGTGFWIQTVVDNIDLPHVKPNKQLRNKLGKKSANQLFQMLKKLDPQRAKTIDKNNSYRLIRAIEIVKSTNKPVPKLKSQSPYNLLMLGVTHPRDTLNKRIDVRLKKRFRQGMIAEVQLLHKNGVSWKRMYDLGLEYRFISVYLRGILTRPEMEEQLAIAIKQFAKRQMTWFQRDKRIKWISNYKQGEQSVNKFLSRK